MTNFFFFFNPCPRSHDQCFVNFALVYNQGKFTLEIKRFSCITHVRCIDAKTVKCARLPLLSILSDKNRRAYQQLSIFARLMSISTGTGVN